MTWIYKYSIIIFTVSTLNKICDNFCLVIIITKDLVSSYYFVLKEFKVRNTIYSSILVNTSINIAT